MPGAPSFVTPGLRPLTGPSGAKITAAIAKIGKSQDGSWVQEVHDYLQSDDGKNYIVGKYGGDAYQQLANAATGQMASLNMKGTPGAMPAAQSQHPFEDFLNFINRPGEAILGGLDAYAKLPLGQKMDMLAAGAAAGDPGEAPKLVQNAQSMAQAEVQGLQGKVIPGGQVVHDLGAHNGIAEALGGTALEFATNPLTYVPLGDFLKPLKAVAKPIADAIADQGVIDTAKLSPKAAAAVEKAYGKASEMGYKAARAFNRFAFFPKTAKELWQGRDAATSARIGELQNAVKRAFGEYYAQTGKQVDDNLLTAVTHHVEDKYYRPWLLEMGRKIPAGTQLAEGTPEWELAEELHGISQDVTAPEVDLGLRSKDLPGYVRHLNLDYRKPTMYGTLGSEAQGMLHAQAFKRARNLLDTVEHMNKNGGNWESNWLLSMGPRLEASIRSQETQKMIDGLLQGARHVSAKDFAKLDFSALAKQGLGVYRADALRFYPAEILSNSAKYLEGVPEGQATVEVPLDALKKGMAVGRQGAYILPRAVADALRETGRRYAKTGISGALDELNGAWKWGMTRLPFFHMHNVLYNAFLGDGGMLLRKRFYSAIDDVAHPETSEMYQRAVQAGAISDWTQPMVRQSLERDKQVMEALARAGGKPRNLAGKVGQVMQDVLWQTDRVMRVSLFRKAIEAGKSDQEAANFVNHFMVDYQDLTPFERDTMRTLFPFYAWQRHNIPLQFEAWLNQTGKQMLPLQLVRNLNYALSQDNLQLARQGKPGSPYDVLAPTSVAGNLLALNLNLPAKDPQELIDEGPAAFLFGRLTPALSLGTELASDQRDPFEGYGSYGQVPIYQPTEPAAPQRVPAFGSSGPMIDPRWQIALNALGTPVQAIGLPLSQFAQTPQQQRMAGISPLEQAAWSALGFYPAAYNPQKQASTNAYLQYLQYENLGTLLRRYFRDYGTPAPTPFTP